METESDGKGKRVSSSTHRLSVFPRIPDVKIEKVIGQGGMGVVFLGRQGYINRRVAVKVLPADAMRAAPGFKERFDREAKILASLSHANIVACHSAGMTSDGDLYLVMEYVEGPTLAQLIDGNGPLSEVQALEVVRSIARALEYALMQGVIHRDVKPENVLLQPQPGLPPDHPFPYVLKLADLGLARQQVAEGVDPRLTGEGFLVGTPATIAPEQLTDPDHVDFRADVYALGCMLFHALTGRAAFPSKNVPEIIAEKVMGTIPDVAALRPDLDPGVASLIRKLMAHRRDDRPQSYAMIMAECHRLNPRVGPPSASFLPAVSSPTSPTPQALRPPSGTRPQDISSAFTLVTPMAGVTKPDVAVVEPSQPAPERRGLLIAGAVAVAALGALAIALFPSKRVPSPPTTTPPPAAVRFGDAKTSLFGGDFLRRLERWGAPLGGASWGAAEEGAGVVGGGKGRIPYVIGPAPWKVEGTMRPSPKESGLRVDTASTAGVLFLVQDFGGRWALSLMPVTSSPTTREDDRGVPTTPVMTPVSERLAFTLTAFESRVVVEAGGQTIGELPLRGAEGVSLVVNGDDVLFVDLTVRARRN